MRLQMCWQLKVAKLIIFLLSARYTAGSSREHGLDALRPYLERVAVDKIVILTQARHSISVCV